QAAGAVATLGSGTVGYEWDVDADNGARPAGLVDLSTTTATGVQVLQDYGSTYGTGNATHHLTLYRAAGGALVFGAGTAQWSWGLDSNHDRGSGAASTPMKQATVNLLADLGAQPATLQSGLTPATSSADTTGPAVTVTSPASGATVQAGTPVTVSGTGTDAGGGVVGSVEVSTDGGTSWHPASGRATWTYSWTPTGLGGASIKVRASDDGATLGAVTAVPVTVAARSCPCTIWAASAGPTGGPDPDAVGTELGTRFTSDVSGTVTAIRFYKQTGNTGTHLGHLWTASGTLLGTVTFTGESATGWQQATLSTPVAITAGTPYVVSYYAPAGHYSATTGYFAGAATDAPPLHAPADTASAPDGVYGYFGAGGGFPSLAWQSANYWVDVVLATGSGGGGDTTPPTVSTRSPAAGATGVSTGTTVTATFSEPIQSGSAVVALAAGGTAVAGSTAYDAASQTVTFTPSAPLAAGTAYTATVSGARDAAGNQMTAASWTFTTATGSPAPPSCPCTIWAATAAPGGAPDPDTSAVEVGTRFRSDVAGQATGVRFYKQAGNTGSHVGRLWTGSGTLLGSVTFTGETASGWQQATFASPIAIAANTTYVVTYHAPAGRYSADTGYFAAGVDRAPLHALRDGLDGPDGVYRYGSGGVFPTDTWQSTNYWVDVVLTTS
ncbi:MAG: DUF4082 domain-containing protein, partial [Mycobacteriales bacterium]